MPRLRTIGFTLVLATVAAFSIGGKAQASTPEDESALGSLDRVTIGAFLMSANPAYQEAAWNIPDVVPSVYRRCDLASYEDELMAARSATRASDWHRLGRCRMSYAGEYLPRLFRLGKDELVKGPDFVAQYPRKVRDPNDFIYRRFTSKPGFYSLNPPSVKHKDAVEYYTEGSIGVGTTYPYGSFLWSGTYHTFVVDQNHIVCAYGVWWTSGYLVGARTFTVIPARSIGPGVSCEGSLVSRRLN